MEPLEMWLWVDPLCFEIPRSYLSHLPLAVVSCYNMTDFRKLKQTEVTLPGIPHEASVTVIY